MEIGIGLPATIPGVKGQLVLDWARRADAGPFSSLGVLDRIVFPNYEPLTTLAAAAAVTQRVRLMTTVLLTTLRNAGVLAKEAATIDVLSNGRLTLGLGIGAREDDFRAAPAPFRNRGKHFEEELALMKRIWSGEAVDDGVGSVGPPPVQQGGPELLIGGYTPAAVQRVGRWGDGFIAGGAGPEVALRLYRIAEETWKATGRTGKPRFVTCMYFGLGPDAAERAGVYIRAYYGFMGQAAEQRARAIPSTTDEVKQAIESFIDIGADELILWPCIPDLEQVDLAAELIS